VKAVLGLFGMTLLTAFLAAPAGSAIIAGTGGAAAPAAGVSLGVVPMTVRIEVAPGKSAEGEIEVSNPGSAAIAVKVYPMDRLTKSTGQVFFNPPGSRRWSAAGWLSLSTTSLSIDPGLVQRLVWKVEVPPDAEPGEHTVVVFFEPERPAAQPGQVVFGARIGTVIAVNVPGERRVQGRLIGFQAEQPPVVMTSRAFRMSFKWPFGIFDGGPIPLSAAFENTGNVRLQATSTVSIRTRSGKAAATINSGEPVTIYPDDGWTISAVWDNPPTWGRFIAEVRVRYAEDQPELVASTAFTVFPITRTLALLAFAAGVWFIRGGVSSLAARRRRSRVKGKEGALPAAAPPSPAGPAAPSVPGPSPLSTPINAPPGERPPGSSLGSRRDRKGKAGGGKTGSNPRSPRAGK